MRTALLFVLMLLIALPFSAGANMRASAGPGAGYTAQAAVSQMSADHDCCPDEGAVAGHAAAAQVEHGGTEVACHPLQEACSDSSGAPCDHCGSCDDHCAPAGAPALAPATGAVLPDGGVLFASLKIPSGCVECPQRPPAFIS